MAEAKELVDFPDRNQCLQKQVQDLIFVDKQYRVEYYSCCAWLQVAIDHRIANCGDVYCNSCYQKFLEKPCPSCQKTIQTSSQDKDFECEVFGLKVQCKFKENGCDEIIELGDFLGHAETCKFATVRIFPKFSKEESTNETLLRLIDAVNRNTEETKQVKEEISQIRDSLKKNKQEADEENKKHKEEFQELRASLTHDVTSMLKQLTDATELRIQEKTELIITEINKLKDDMKISENTFEKLIQAAISQMFDAI